VVDRAGALELAEGGTLFLDEVHNLPPRVQRSLLRFAEDGLLAPLGSGAAARRADVRMILGTNASVEEACDDGRLARDLMARLHRVAIPPLRERRADVPHIFQRVLHRALPAETAELISSHLDAPLVERLCLHDYRWGNVRELEELAAVVGARLAEGEEPARALRETADALLAPAGSAPRDADWAPPPRSPYEQRRAEIVAAYREAGGNLKQLEATLRARGFECNRRWLTIFLDRWGVREIRKRG
jgi:DNA-binding NtrC family response regulator